jgi:hypothetical protein
VKNKCSWASKQKIELYLFVPPVRSIYRIMTWQRNRESRKDGHGKCELNSKKIYCTLLLKTFRPLSHRSCANVSFWGIVASESLYAVSLKCLLYVLLSKRQMSSERQMSRCAWKKRSQNVLPLSSVASIKSCYWYFFVHNESANGEYVAHELKYQCGGSYHAWTGTPRKRSDVPHSQNRCQLWYTIREGS